MPKSHSIIGSQRASLKRMGWTSPNSGVVVTFSSLGGASAEFKVSNATYSTITQAEIDSLKQRFLLNYPNIDPKGVSFELTSGSIIVKITYNGSADMNSLSSKQLAAISNLSSVFSNSTTMLSNFKDAVTSIGNPVGLSFAVNASINDSDITINVDVRLADRIKEKVPQLSPLLLCYGTNNNVYTNDLKDSILKLNISDGTTKLITRIQPTIAPYLTRGLLFKGISSDGLYLTVDDLYGVNSQQVGNFPVDYVYRVNTVTGEYAKVELYDSPQDPVMTTWYDPFTDSVYWNVNGNNTSPIKYQFNGLATYTKTTSNEKFPAHRMLQSTYIDANTICYGTGLSIRKWNKTTGTETSMISFSAPGIGTTFQSNYDSVTDTLIVHKAGQSKEVILIKGLCTSSASIDKTITIPTTDTEVAFSYILPGGDIAFAATFNQPCFDSLTLADLSYWKCYRLYKIENDIIVPFTCFDTT